MYSPFDTTDLALVVSTISTTRRSTPGSKLCHLTRLHRQQTPAKIALTQKIFQSCCGKVRNFVHNHVLFPLMDAGKTGQVSFLHEETVHEMAHLSVIVKCVIVALFSLSLGK